MNLEMNVIFPLLPFHSFSLDGTSLKHRLLFQILYRAYLSENFCEVNPFLILMP